jgi:hypothetical protein
VRLSLLVADQDIVLYLSAVVMADMVEVSLSEAADIATVVLVVRVDIEDNNINKITHIDKTCQLHPVRQVSFFATL